MVDKIKVNLSYKVYHQILADMESFHFYKENGETNLNLFMNVIVKGMYERNTKLDNEMELELDKILAGVNNVDIKDSIKNQLSLIIADRLDDKSNRSVGYYISFRPSAKYSEIYDEIELNHLSNNTISSYFRGLFNEYAHMSQDTREEIVFKDTLKLITSAINTKSYLSTIDKKITNFIPYCISKTSDELYNYVIGATIRNGYFHPFSLHLYKATKFIKEKKHFELSEDDINKFEKIIVKGPREIEIRSGEAEVVLTQKGIKLFKQYYLNRPIPTKIEANHYFFNSSIENIFVYFSRFGNNVDIISPVNLRNQMKNFHKHAYNTYENANEKN